jgi:hypothetical protein
VRNAGQLGALQHQALIATSVELPDIGGNLRAEQEPLSYLPSAIGERSVSTSFSSLRELEPDLVKRQVFRVCAYLKAEFAAHLQHARVGRKHSPAQIEQTFRVGIIHEVLHQLPADALAFEIAAHDDGGKDSHPFPVPLRVYDETIRVLKSAVQNARLGREEELGAIKRLDQQARQLEAWAKVPSFEAVVAEERQASSAYGGHSVFGWEQSSSSESAQCLRQGSSGSSRMQR